MANTKTELSKYVRGAPVVNKNTDDVGHILSFEYIGNELALKLIMPGDVRDIVKLTDVELL